MIARFWVLVVGLEHVADIKPLGLKCGSKWFFAGVGGHVRLDPVA